MKSIKSIGLVLAATLLMNVSYVQKEKTVEVGGVESLCLLNLSSFTSHWPAHQPGEAFSGCILFV